MFIRQFLSPFQHQRTATFVTARPGTARALCQLFARGGAHLLVFGGAHSPSYPLSKRNYWRTGYVIITRIIIIHLVNVFARHVHLGNGGGGDGGGGDGGDDYPREARYAPNGARFTRHVFFDFK